MTYFKKFIWLIFIVIVLGGCFAKTVPNGHGDPVEQRDRSPFFHTGPSDKERFDEALSFLRNGEKEPNYIEAKNRLEDIIRQYPKSKWAEGAQALIGTLEKISTLQIQVKHEQERAKSDCGKLAKDIEGLKDNIRQMADRHSAEIAKLQQENEQLKNDIQQLKKLEVQLEKREKMLR